ncbi:DNA/RNA polymerases superfamily protein [Gossypium australe]|uniref:DNA/RNA polymerases superfamily protein n=1 Tax=Gossypium australe TaxID=47621 RepID=A0A5B6WZC1_9ROSI|nr:DNA/RNA polymerases superfamily protein [Gossypium australe]
MDYSLEKLAELYVNEIVRLHCVPLSIISDRDSSKLHEALDTKLKFSRAFHPQTDGQTERVIQILEDMLRCCIIEFEVEFAYNNSYQVSLKMTPYEALYERKCRSPLCWSELSERKLERVVLIRDNLKAATNPYRLTLPPKLEKIHNVFHVSMLRRYKSDPSHIVAPCHIEIQLDLSYFEGPIKILAREVKELRNKKVPLVKVLWKHHGVEESMWETEEWMKSQYPNLFSGYY